VPADEPLPASFARSRDSGQMLVAFKRVAFEEKFWRVFLPAVFRHFAHVVRRCRLTAVEEISVPGNAVF
jgi:hypothetical protein